MRNPVTVIAMLSVPLAGCALASQAPAYRFWAGQQQESAQTQACTTGLPPFGISLSQGLYPPNGTMATHSDGAWCALNVMFTYGAPSRVEVVQQPLHGALRVDPLREGLSLAYEAAGNYAGLDSFSVMTEVGGRAWTIPVAVTVTR